MTGLVSCSEPPTKEETYQEKLAEVLTGGSVAQCIGLNQEQVLAFHKKREEGLAGSMLSGDDMKLMNCDYQIRLLAEGREEFRGLE